MNKQKVNMTSSTKEKGYSSSSHYRISSEFEQSEQVLLFATSQSQSLSSRLIRSPQLSFAFRRYIELSLRLSNGDC